jgi:type VI secretion system secreted protein Hcp
VIKCSFKFKQDPQGEYVKVQDETVVGRYSEVRGGSLTVEVPTDEKTGTPVSSRQYTPLEIIKFIDSASPIIFSGITKGTKFSEAVVTMYKYNTSKGEEEAYYEMVFENVTFTKQKEILSEGYENAGKETLPMEAVCLVAEKVTKTFIDGHISHPDEYKSKAKSSAAA